MSVKDKKTDKFIEDKIREFRKGWANDEQLEEFIAVALKQAIEYGEKKGFVEGEKDMAEYLREGNRFGLSEQEKSEEE